MPICCVSLIPSSLQRTDKYASLLRISGSLASGPFLSILGKTTSTTEGRANHGSLREIELAREKNSKGDSENSVGLFRYLPKMDGQRGLPQTGRISRRQARSRFEGPTINCPIQRSVKKKGLWRPRGNHAPGVAFASSLLGPCDHRHARGSLHGPNRRH